MYRIAMLLACLLVSHSPVDGDELGDAVRLAVRTVDPAVVRLRVIGGSQAVDGEKVTSLITTGVVVSANGEILTSLFALQGGPEAILAEDINGQRTNLEVVATDHVRRLVLLKAREGRWTPVNPAPHDSVLVGQWSIAVGRFYAATASNVSVGIVSALNRIHGMATQTDAKISPVNYGGPLVNLEGQVIGILVPLSPRGQGSATTGIEWYDSGIGFAIPMTEALQIAERLRQGNDLKPGRLGLRLVAAGSFSPEARVDRVIPMSPAAVAGLKKDDLIVKVNDSLVERAGILEEILARSYAGDAVTLDLKRDNETVIATLILAEQLPVVTQGYLGLMSVRTSRETIAKAPADAIAALLQPGIPAPTENLRPELIPQFDAVPLLVVNDSPASRAGLTGRVEITAVNAVKTPSFGELQVALDEITEGATIAVEYRVSGESEVKNTEIVAESLPNQVTRLSDSFLLALNAAGSAAIELMASDAVQSDPVPADGENAVVVQRRELPFDERGHCIVFSSASNAGVLPGIVILLSAQGLTEEEILRQWEPFLASHKLVVAIPVNPEKSTLTADDIPLVTSAIRGFAAGAKADLRRIVVIADRSQSDLAWELTLGGPSPIRGIALSNGWIPSADAEAADGSGLSVLLLESPQNAESRALLVQSRSQLRRAGFWSASPSGDDPIREIADWSLLLRAF